MSEVDIPQVCVDAVKLYYENRGEYKRLLKYAKSIIGKIILPENATKIEKAKQRDDALPEKRQRISRPKRTRIKESYSKEFVAVYKVLE